jgi:hypothetical protein
MDYPVGLLDQMDDVLKAEARARRRAESKARANRAMR